MAVTSMKARFFPDAKLIGLVKSGVRSGRGAGPPCVLATNRDLVQLLDRQELEQLRDIELQAGELTDREVEVTAADIFYEITHKCDRYQRMCRQETGEDCKVHIDAEALRTLFRETTAYGHKNEVYELLAEWLEQEIQEEYPGVFGDFVTPAESTGTWVRHERAPLEQKDMPSPAMILCGIYALGDERRTPDYLVRAGSMYALAHGSRSRRKRVAVQRVGHSLCVANSRYDGPLNMNSEGLQLERLLCGFPQYLRPDTDAFKEYANKQVFVVKEVKIPSAKGTKTLCTYYHAFAHSADKRFKGRVQVDSSGDPQRYRLQTGAHVKDTAIQMWSRDQRFLHHTEWDLSKDVSAQAFGGPEADFHEAKVCQDKIAANLERIRVASDRLEEEHNTSDKWYSYAQYLHHDTVGHNPDVEMQFAEESVRLEDRALRPDELQIFKQKTQTFDA